MKFLNNLTIRWKIVLLVLPISFISVYGIVLFAISSWESRERAIEIDNANHASDYMLFAAGEQMAARQVKVLHLDEEAQEFSVLAQIV